MSDDKGMTDALRGFAGAVTAKMTQLTAGEPEEQLRGPFETLMDAVGQAISLKVVCTGETRLAGRVGKPDFAVHAADLLAGYVELKAPGKGADPKRFKGHDREQWKRFQAIPNLIYCDGNDWGLYRDGERVRSVVRLSGDVASDGKKAVADEDAAAVLDLLRDFLQWQPTIPTKTKGGKIDLAAFADMLAPLCRMLRDDVAEAMQDKQSPLVALADDWRKLLFPEADDEQFADAYAQTVTFALLLARSEGADPLTLDAAEAALAAEHSLLSRALRVLTDPNALAEISAPVNLLVRVIAEVPPTALTGPEDPWLYFYEDFLAAYDPKLRKDAGAYYTPVEVVRAQVRLIDDLLTNRLGKPLGFADDDVVTLDPAAGTGTYLLGVIEHALNKVASQQGAGAVPGQATALAKNLYGFELMVGPFAVSELRVSRALADRGATPPPDGTHVYLTDTLESPHAQPPQLPLFLKPIADQHAKALKVKADVPVIVCLGNPPYDRHEAADDDNRASTGGWVRWGDDGEGKGAIFRDFLAPAIDAGHALLVRNIYNLYVYFWRWALWKVFESKTASGPGVVSFISASSYIDGDAFCGMREHMRRLCDDVWILDLGGEGRGTRQNENVFAIQTPVAIGLAVRYGQADIDTPANVHYATMSDGTRSEKLKALDDVAEFASLLWRACPSEWQAAFRPTGTGSYFRQPSLDDLFPWTLPGVTPGRTWVIAPDSDTLAHRWRALAKAGEAKRSALFKESNSGCTLASVPLSLDGTGNGRKPIAEVSKTTAVPTVDRYGFRSLDRQYVLADSRLLDRPRPPIWAQHSPRQAYLTSLLHHPMGPGPALMGCAQPPDKHHFRGSYGGKDIMPLYRDSEGKEPNILPGLLNLLGKTYGRDVSPEDFLAYVYGALAHPAFTERFYDELANCQVRVPVTKNADLFEKVRAAGAKLLWLHTYGERFVPPGQHKGRVPRGAAKCTRPIPGDADGYPEDYDYNEATKTLHVGDGEFAPVSPEVYEFEVSGLKVVQSWLGYRMKEPKGRKSSPLDEINPETWPRDFTTELLELLWVLEATLAEYPAQAKLLHEVVSGECFTADELPDVPDEMRKPPKRKKQPELFDEDDGD